MCAKEPWGPPGRSSALTYDNDASKADDIVFSSKYRDCSDANIYNAFKRVLKIAGIDPWPDLWRNLRASGESELLQKGYNIKGVCIWLGNTPQFVMKHYLRTDPDSLRKATAQVPSSDDKTPESDAGDQIGDQHLPEEGVRTRTKVNTRRELRQQKPLVLRSNTKKATPNTEWLYALERTRTSTGLSPTSPSSWRVYQFHHQSVVLKMCRLVRLLRTSPILLSSTRRRASGSDQTRNHNTRKA